MSKNDAVRFQAFAFLVIFILLIASAVPTLAAKNVILMVGDGMGFKHLEATRNYLGRSLAMQSMPVKYGVSTYEYGGSYNSSLAWSNFSYVLNNPTDSASAATALSTGYKADDGNIATDHNDQHRLTTMTEYARTVGKASGVVSSVPFSHATPAAFAAHNSSRNNYSAIAHEMITSFGNGTGSWGNTPTVDVIIGGGHPAYGSTYISSTDYTALKNGTTGQGWTFVERQTGVNGTTSLMNASMGASKLFGLYGGSGGNLPYRLASGSGRNAEHPTVTDMAKAALNVLEKDPEGMFLMIEGGAIDWASHNNSVDQMIGEVIDFDNAVSAVMNWVDTHDPSWTDTLLIVTADHETGYLTRGSGIFANQALVNPGTGILPVNGTHFRWNSTGHTNSIVPLFARGAGSDLFAGYATGYDSGYNMNYLDNTNMFNVMYASTVPEPTSILALGLGLSSLAACLRRRR